MEILADLHQLTNPMLLLWGEKDQFQPLATAERFHQNYLQSELQIIPDSDHFLPFEKGPEVAQILLDFLGEVRPL
jgi:pimeloyl-ACP methyl ester carboxylesterase